MSQSPSSHEPSKDQGNQPVLYRVEFGVAEVILNRPDRRNALSRELVQALTAALKRAEADTQVQAILLRSEGASFCTGGDIGEFALMREKSPVTLNQDGKADAELFSLGKTLRKPLVAAVQGHAFGGGMGLVALAHIVVAGQSTQFGLTEIKLGLFPFNVSPLIIDAIGFRATRELALTGRLIDASEAQRLGLVHHIVPEQELLARAQEVVRAIAGRSPVALRLGMDAFALSRSGYSPEVIDAMNALRTVVFTSEDLQEGAKAYLEKRKPLWKGR